MAGWGPVQEVVNKAVAAVQKIIDEGAAKLVDALKPLLAKVLAIVVDKLGKAKEEKEEKKGPAVGDTVSKWDFGKTDLGGKFSNTLKEKGPKDAWFDLNAGLKDAVNNAIESRLTSAAKSALGEGRASMEIVKIILEAVAQQIGKVLRQYTTVTPLAKAVEPIAAIVAELEVKLGEKKGDKDAQIKLVNEYSGKWWVELGEGGLAMYMAFVKLKDAINSDMSGVCEDGVKPMQDYADNLFQIQMRVVNAVRVVFTDKLKAAISGGGDGSAAVRAAFRDAAFDHIGLLVSESWIQFTAAILASTLAQVLDKFDRDIWPSIEEPLKLLEEMIPEALKSAGLKIVPLARTIIVMLITKGVTWALTKLTMACEKGLFSQ
jgi:molybdopterin converting factor small subunit